MLSELLNRASDTGLITGLVPHLVEGGLTHLPYADDTILFVENTENNIVMLKLILFCYEEMSSMRINYSKSEVFVVGVD